MKLAFETEENFADLIPFLKTMALEIPNNKKVWSAFLKWSSLLDWIGWYALSYGTSPLVRVLDIDEPYSRYSNGHFDPANPVYINVNWSYAVNVNGALRDGRTPTIENAKMLESLLLHELCHWGRWFNNVKDGQFEFGDSGDMFKREAYKDPLRPHLG